MFHIGCLRNATIISCLPVVYTEGRAGHLHNRVKMVIGVRKRHRLWLMIRTTLMHSDSDG